MKNLMVANAGFQVVAIAAAYAFYAYVIQAWIWVGAVALAYAAVSTTAAVVRSGKKVGRYKP